jgi:threonine dehydrogenase-like Zn-dependent dehydrogenase
MPTYKSFAVVGGGTVGLPIVSALTSYGASVILLSRPGSSPKTVPPTVKVVQVDYNDVAATAAVFKKHKVDVVIATLGLAAVLVQKPLVDAAKLAAVKLFVPSEFATPTDSDVDANNPVAAIGEKYQIAGTNTYIAGLRWEAHKSHQSI